MEDLYGITKTVPPQEPKFHRTNFGRVTPSDLNRSRHGFLTGRSSPSELNNKPRQQGLPVSPELNKSRQGFSGRLTPVDPKLLRQQAGPQAAAGLLNISSHNSSKLSSTNSGANSCHTKTTMDSSHHDLNSTQISPISATRKALLDRLNSTGTSQHNGGSRLPREKRQNLSNLLLVSSDSGVREMMQSLGLLCIVSLLLALLSLVFLLKISPMPEKPELEFLTQSEYTTVYEVSKGSRT